MIRLASWIMRLYPPDYREKHESEILGHLDATSTDGTGPGAVTEAATLLVNALAVNLRAALSRRSHELWRHGYELGVLVTVAIWGAAAATIAERGLAPPLTRPGFGHLLFAASLASLICAARTQRKAVAVLCLGFFAVSMSILASRAANAGPASISSGPPIWFGVLAVSVTLVMFVLARSNRITTADLVLVGAVGLVGIGNGSPILLVLGAAVVAVTSRVPHWLVGALVASTSLLAFAIANDLAQAGDDPMPWLILIAAGVLASLTLIMVARSRMPLTT
ncbi:MAG TPA: hypothetical protein VJA46_13690 [Acidimicrobiia bacterium]|nr:hypothetical protein [Acidimicrobiia bacterium]